MDKRILGVVFACGLLKVGGTPEAIAERVGSDPEGVRRRLEELVRVGLLKKTPSGFVLTGKGRSCIRVVFIGGKFEIIHIGHLHTIRSAKKLGDLLVAVVARDSTIRREKLREPVIGESERVTLLSALRDVDVAMLGSEVDIYETLQKVSPDVVALGYDQHHAEADIAKEAERRGMAVDVVRLDTPHPRIKTSRILNEF